MTRLFLALVATTLLLLGGLAGAQTPSPGADTTPTVKLTAEQHHVIKEIVLKDMRVEKATGNTPDAVGATVPDGVQLHAFPPEIANRIPQVRSHSFFVKGDQVYIVSPKDKTIADVIH